MEFQFPFGTSTTDGRRKETSVPAAGLEASSWSGLKGASLPLSSFRTVPDHAHFVCKDLDAVGHLVSEPPLADLIETIWIVGGTQVYKVMKAASLAAGPEERLQDVVY